VLWEPTVTAVDHMTVVSNAKIAAQIGSGPQWKDMGLKMLARARALCPVSHVEQVAGQYGPQQVGGALKASMEARFQFGPDPMILIGSTLQTIGNKPVNLFALNELGTEAHLIAPAPGGVLAFVAGGTLVVTSNPVHHPGTKKNPFVERAAQQILHEMAGLTLVHV
jgi:hypothetical protein